MHDSDTKAGEQLVAKELRTPTDLASDAIAEISTVLRRLLADVFALYLKTKNFHENKKSHPPAGVAYAFRFESIGPRSIGCVGFHGRRPPSSRRGPGSPR
jgi:hypothetical protein